MAFLYSNQFRNLLNVRLRGFWKPYWWVPGSFIKQNSNYLKSHFKCDQNSAHECFVLFYTEGLESYKINLRPWLEGIFLYPMFYVKCCKDPIKMYLSDITWASLTFHFQMFWFMVHPYTLAHCTWFYGLRSSPYSLNSQARREKGNLCSSSSTFWPLLFQVCSFSVLW